MLFNCAGQVPENFACLVLGKKEIVRGLKAGFELAQIVVTGYEHGPWSLITYTTLRTNVISQALCSAFYRSRDKMMRPVQISAIRSLTSVPLYFRKKMSMPQDR